jgi:hypothetical protein
MHWVDRQRFVSSQHATLTIRARVGLYNKQRQYQALGMKIPAESFA